MRRSRVVARAAGSPLHLVAVCHVVRELPGAHAPHIHAARVHKIARALCHPRGQGASYVRGLRYGFENKLAGTCRRAGGRVEEALDCGSEVGVASDPVA